MVRSFPILIKFRCTFCQRLVRVSLLYCYATVFLLAIAGRTGEDFKVSHSPQLFLDDQLIANMRNLRRDVKQPTKHPANPLITPDQPWERRMIEFYGTVLFDKDANVFRCWYLASESVPPRPSITFATPNPMMGFNGASRLSVQNHSADQAPQHRHPRRARHFGNRRYRRPRSPARYKAAGGDVFGTSPDGVHWRMENNRYAVHKNDTCSSLVRWNSEYLLFVKIKNPRRAPRFTTQKPARTGQGRWAALGCARAMTSVDGPKSNQSFARMNKTAIHGFNPMLFA